MTKEAQAAVAAAVEERVLLPMFVEGMKSAGVQINSEAELAQALELRQKLAAAGRLTAAASGDSVFAKLAAAGAVASPSADLSQMVDALLMGA